MKQWIKIRKKVHLREAKQSKEPKSWPIWWWLSLVAKGVSLYFQIQLISVVSTNFSKHRGLYKSRIVLNYKKKYLHRIFKSISSLEYWLWRQKSSNFYSIWISRVFYIALFFIFSGPLSIFWPTVYWLIFWKIREMYIFFKN